MSKLVARCFSVSLDGYGAGPAQSLADPLGRGGEELHDWFVKTDSFQRMHGGGEGRSEGVDEGFAAEGLRNIGAWILGRNMFGPLRGPWPDEAWKGWWGEDPPFHCPVFVLTHYPRPDLVMAGGTTFHFVTEGLEAALEGARVAAGGRDVRLGGGVATLRAGFAKRLIDEAHLAVSPVLLGQGEALFPGLDLPGLGYRVGAPVAGEAATHYLVTKA